MQLKYPQPPTNRMHCGVPRFIFIASPRGCIVPSERRSLARQLLSRAAPAWIVHECGEIWVEQGFSPAFTARMGLAALSPVPEKVYPRGANT